eukprot:gene21511-33097_t
MERCWIYVDPNRAPLQARLKEKCEDFRVNEIDAGGRVVVAGGAKGMPPQPGFVKEYLASEKALEDRLCDSRETVAEKEAQEAACLDAATAAALAEANAACRAADGSAAASGLPRVAMGELTRLQRIVLHRVLRK